MLGTEAQVSSGVPVHALYWCQMLLLFFLLLTGVCNTLALPWESQHWCSRSNPSYGSRPLIICTFPVTQ